MSAVYSAIKSCGETFPDNVAIVHAEGESLTYSTLIKAIDSAALYLYQRLHSHPGYDFVAGVWKQNPPIVLLARDSLQTIVSVIAMNRLGLTVAPLNPDTGISALRRARDGIEAGAVLCDNHFSAKAESLQSEHCLLLKLSDLPVGTCSASGDLPRIAEAPQYPYLLTMSSGSTGDPKPVVYTDYGKVQRARFTAGEFGLCSDDTILCASPFFHSLGQRLTYMPLVTGATMVLLPRFTVENWLDAAYRHHVTATICVSSHLFALKDFLIKKDGRAQSIRVLVSSSASIDNDTKYTLFDQDQFDFYEMYGASEVATATRLGSADPMEKRGSVGVACKGVEIMICDEQKQKLAADKLGEIYVKSPLCSPGYYRREDLNSHAFHQGWFQTGDMGYLDPDGYLYFVDRASDVIISGGSNLYPSDIEACIRDCPAVIDCVVVGVKDSYLGEAAIAIVVSDTSGEQALERDIRRHARESLASSEQPLLYFIVKELPLNGAGKIDRKAIRHNYNNMGLDPSARFSHVLFSKASA